MLGNQINLKWLEARAGRTKGAEETMTRTAVVEKWIDAGWCEEVKPKKKRGRPRKPREGEEGYVPPRDRKAEVPETK